MKMTWQEMIISQNIERIQRCKDYFLYEILRHSNEWLCRYKSMQVDCFNKNYAECPEEADYFAEVYQEEVFDYELIDYNVVGAMIVSIMGILEQQLQQFNTTIESFDKTSLVAKIIEFKNLANVIKHGAGHSLEKLKEQNSRFVKQENDCYINEKYERLKSYRDIILNFSHEDLEECCHLLMDFWKSFNITVGKKSGATHET